MAATAAKRQRHLLTIEDEYDDDDKDEDFEELVDGQQMGEDDHSAYYEEITVVLVN